MVKSMRSKLSLYYKEIRKAIPLSSKHKRRIISDIDENVKNYLLENPEASFADIKTRFGTPEQISAMYVTELDTPQLLSSFQVKHSILKIIAIACAACFLVWLGIVISAFINEIDNADGYVDVQIIDNGNLN